MTDPVRKQFEEYAIRIEDLREQFGAAVTGGNLALAKTLAATIKEAEAVRDRLLCCLGAVLSAADEPVPSDDDGTPPVLH
jgi:hypothetical protein